MASSEPTLTAVSPKLQPALLRWLVALALGALFYLVAVRIVEPSHVPNSDFFMFWLSGHMAGLGQDPYSTTAWLSAKAQFGSTWMLDTSFIYPLPVALFFVPLGWLSPDRAAVTWAWLSQVMIAFSLVLLLRLYPRPLAAKYALPLAVGLIAFHPLILTLLNGQLGALLLLTLSSIAYLWERDRWWQGALLLPVLLAFKPSLGAPLCLLLGLYLLQRRTLPAIAAAAASALGLACLGWLRDPAWVAKFLTVGSHKLSEAFGISPTVWGVSSYLCRMQRPCSFWLGALLAAIALVLAATMLYRRRATLGPAWFAGFAAALALLVTPYVWSYDQLLLAIPLILVTMNLARSGARFLPSALLLPGMDVLAFALLWIAGLIRLGVWSAVLPAVVLSLMALPGWQPAAAGSAPTTGGSG